MPQRFCSACGTKNEYSEDATTLSCSNCKKPIKISPPQKILTVEKSEKEPTQKKTGGISVLLGLDPPSEEKVEKTRKKIVKKKIVRRVVKVGQEQVVNNSTISQNNENYIPNNSTISENRSGTSLSSEQPQQKKKDSHSIPKPSHMVRNESVSPFDKVQPRQGGDIKQCKKCNKVDLFGKDKCEECKTPYEEEIEVFYEHKGCKNEKTGGGISYKKMQCTSCKLSFVVELPVATNVNPLRLEQVRKQKRDSQIKLFMSQAYGDSANAGNEHYRSLDPKRKEKLNECWQEVNPGQFHNDNITLGNEHEKIAEAFKKKILTQLKPNEVKAYATTLKKFMFGRFGFAKEFAEVFTAEQFEAIASNHETHEFALDSVINELGVRYVREAQALEVWLHDEKIKAKGQDLQEIENQYKKKLQDLKNILKRKLDAIKAHKTPRLDLRLGIAYRLIGEPYEESKGSKN